MNEFGTEFWTLVFGLRLLPTALCLVPDRDATAQIQSGVAIKAMRLTVVEFVDQDFIGQIINYQPMFAHLRQVRRGIRFIESPGI